MLELRPGCECCDRDLPADQPGAYICSFECTWCTDCAVAMDYLCPNCGGALVARPLRVGVSLQRNPASTTRVFRPREA